VRPILANSIFNLGFTPMRRNSFLLVVAVLIAFATPAAAAQPLTIEGFWSGFRRFWSGVFGDTDGVVAIAVMTGIIGIFIITRGKWLK
jgi:hypothetical protein